MNNLTLLQRGVIKRLRDAGFGTLADNAFRAWSEGQKLGIMSYPMSRDTELRLDFIRANKQKPEGK